MALLKPKLTEIINDAIAASDSKGLPISSTAEMGAYADAVIMTLTSAIVTLPLVQGTAPPVPGPVLDLQASNGKLLPPLLAPTWITALTAGSPLSNPALLSTEALASTSYLTTASMISFGIGTLTGTSTAAPGAPPLPGILVFTSGSGGKISGIDGAAWAAMATAPGGNPADTKKFYTAIADYITENAEVIFVAGTVNGTFAAPAAPLVAGIGAGGMII